MKRPHHILITCAILAAATLTVRADPPELPPTLFRLSPDSSYIVGCFNGCTCPITSTDLKGTFVVTFIGFDGLFWSYDVTDVQLTAFQGGNTISLSGSGTYVVGGEFALMQQLQLGLVVDEQAFVHFDSGLIDGGSGFPKIDIDVNINQLQCTDTILRFRARPLGDVNADGAADLGDLDSFVAVLLGQDSDPDHAAFADMTLDDLVNGNDIQPFIEILTD